MLVHDHCEMDGLLLAWDRNNDDSHGNNQDVHEFLALLCRADIRVIWKVGNESEQQDKEQDDCGTRGYR